nr:hypothetical protein [Pandoravirus massiliensis]
MSLSLLFFFGKKHHYQKDGDHASMSAPARGRCRKAARQWSPMRIELCFFLHFPSAILFFVGRCWFLSTYARPFALESRPHRRVGGGGESEGKCKSQTRQSKRKRGAPKSTTGRRDLFCFFLQGDLTLRLLFPAAKKKAPKEVVPCGYFPAPVLGCRSTACLGACRVLCPEGSHAQTLRRHPTRAPQRDGSLFFLCWQAVVPDNFL